MAKLQEIWKDVPGFERRYQVSNKGRIKSLERIDRLGRVVPKKILRPTLKYPYLVIGLYKPLNDRKKRYPWYVHRLIVYTFTGILPTSIDHLNGIKTDNRLLNLEDVTQRENVHRYRRGARDLPIGVCVIKGPRRKKYQAYINFNGKQHILGNFLTSEEAHVTYLNKLRDINGN
jgi:hypothetical protein